MQIFYMVVFVGGLVLLIDFLAICVLNNEVAQSDGIALSRRGWRTVALSLAVMLAAGVLYVFPPPDAVYSAIGLLLYPFVRLVQLVANVVGIDSDVLKNLGDTEYSSWVRESNYGWAISLTFHAFGNAAVVGLTYIIGLRFVGVFRTISFTSLLKFFPVIWLGIVVQVLSGGSLWMTKPGRYTGDSVRHKVYACRCWDHRDHHPSKDHEPRIHRVGRKRSRVRARKVFCWTCRLRLDLRARRRAADRVSRHVVHAVTNPQRRFRRMPPCQTEAVIP
jgi:hypothetical protein